VSYNRQHKGIWPNRPKDELLDMADNLSHLRNMKRRLTQSKSHVDMSAADKVDLLENTLNVFRAEVDMKLKIMQQILTTRNGET